MTQAEKYCWRYVIMFLATAFSWVVLKDSKMTFIFFIFGIVEYFEFSVACKELRRQRRQLTDEHNAG